MVHIVLGPPRLRILSAGLRDLGVKIDGGHPPELLDDVRIGAEQSLCGVSELSCDLGIVGLFGEEERGEAVSEIVGPCPAKGVSR